MTHFIKTAVLTLILSQFISCAQMPAPIGGDPTGLSVQRVSQKNAVQHLYQEAVTANSDGLWTKAEAALERALRIEPANAHLWLGLAQVAKAQYQLDKALELSQRALSFTGSDSALRKKIEAFIASLR